ncbi:dTDP-4-dehydrorhamnose 3,5-epimerase [Chloroflexota bacterium]
MLIKEGKLKGVFEIDLESHEDHRGFFVRTYDNTVFRTHGLHTNWVQDNHSYSQKKGTLRGLHFQFQPHAETKLVRAVSGEAFIAFVDLRKDSPTLGQWDSDILSVDKMRMLYIPETMALGMCTLTDNCTLLYKIGKYYVPESQGAIKWDDPDIGIDWPLSKEPIISEKDSKAMSFREFTATYGGLEA